VQAAVKSFTGPTSKSYAMPSLPRGEFKPKKKFSFSS
jgi:uncharacterized protein (DUF2345 family)